MGNNAKKHHFIPQCYLKGFQYGNSKIPKIVVYDKKSMDNYIAAINKTACIEGFHTVKHEGELNKNIIEQILSKYEEAYIRRLKKVINTCYIDSKDKYILSKMMLMLRYRNPKFAKVYKVFFQKKLEAIAELNFQKNNLKQSGSFKDKFKINVYNNCYIKKFIEAFNNKEAIRRIYSMNFSLLEVFENEYFLCSDSPVSFYKQSSKNNDFQFEIFFPLNKNFAILCSDHSILPYKKLTKKEVVAFNINTILFADKYIYSPHKNDSIKLMIEMVNKYSCK